MKKESIIQPFPAKLAKPAQRALANAGIKTMADFSRFTQAEVANLHGIGPNALKEITRTMQETGISFQRN